MGCFRVMLPIRILMQNPLFWKLSLMVKILVLGRFSRKFKTILAQRKIPVHHRDHINHLLRLITGISPVSFSAPGKVFSHALTFRWLIYVTLMPSIQPHSSRVFCGVITIQPFMTRILTGIPLINPACGIHSPYR